MRILVLGGNGYLGSKVISRLLEERHEVVCTRRTTSDLSRVEDILNSITWIEATQDAVRKEMCTASLDYVINLACNYGKDNLLSKDAVKANLEFPLSVLCLAVENGVKHYLTIGTSLPDDFNIYSFTKSKLRDFGKFYADRSGIDFINLRLEMFYGADEPKTRFLPATIVKMIRGEDVDTTMGTQHRDIIAIDNVVDAIMMIVNKAPSGFNDISVGTGVAPSISEIIDYIWLQTGEKAKVNKGAVPMRKDEPDCVADVSYLESIGKWEPIDWKTGIFRMIDNIQKQIMEGKL